jgi:hypothetical protein
LLFEVPRVKILVLEEALMWMLLLIVTLAWILGLKRSLQINMDLILIRV